MQNLVLMVLLTSSMHIFSVLNQNTRSRTTRRIISFVCNVFLKSLKHHHSSLCLLVVLITNSNMFNVADGETKTTCIKPVRHYNNNFLASILPNHFKIYQFNLYFVLQQIQAEDTTMSKLFPNLLLVLLVHTCKFCWFSSLLLVDPCERFML